MPTVQSTVLLDNIGRKTRRGALIRQETDLLSLQPADDPSFVASDSQSVSDKLQTQNKTGPSNTKKNEQAKGSHDPSSKDFGKEIFKERKEVEWGAILGNEALSVAERLSLAVKIHAFLCDTPTHDKLQERVDEVARTELLSPMLNLARVIHPLNYVALRLLLLFTHTSKSLLLLSQLGAIPTVMVCLSRPQELECIRYCLEILRWAVATISTRALRILISHVWQQGVHEPRVLQRTHPR